MYSYEELATLRPRISTDRSQIAVLTPIGSPDVCTSVDSCLGRDMLAVIMLGIARSRVIDFAAISAGGEPSSIVLAILKRF